MNKKNTFPPGGTGDCSRSPYEPSLLGRSAPVTGTCTSLAIFQGSYTHILMWVCLGTQFKFGEPPPNSFSRILVSVCQGNKPMNASTLSGSRAVLTRSGNCVTGVSHINIFCTHLLWSLAQQRKHIAPVEMPVNDDHLISAKPNGSLHFIGPLNSLTGCVADISIFSR